MQTIAEHPYYNLLIGYEIDWERNNITLPIDRFLEFTSTAAFNSTRKDLYDEYLQELVKYPALILNERDTIRDNGLSYAGCVGIITDYTLSDSFVSAKFKSITPISIEDVLKIELSLEMNPYGYTEFNRTHWAVKKVNLKKVIDSTPNLSIKLHPTIFISYSWTMDDAEAKVTALAEYLENNGVEVIYDRNSAKPGMELIYFMEQIMREADNFKKILVLSDSTYMNKANSRIDGVGTEAKLLMPLVVNNPGQTQVIPIFMEDHTKVPYFLDGIFGIYFDNKEEILKNIFSD